MKITKTFFDDIRKLIATARNTVARGVDLVQVHTNFEIGRRIVDQEQRGKGRADYGEEIIKELSRRLTSEYGRGFSATNLAYMRTFYLLYEDRAIFQSATGKLESVKKFQSATGKSSRSQAVKAGKRSRQLSKCRVEALHSLSSMVPFEDVLR